MAERSILRQRLERDVVATSLSTRASRGDEIRLVADIAAADLQNTARRWRMSAWRSADNGATWHFLFGQTDEGRAGRTDVSRIAHAGGDLAGQLVQLRVTSLDGPMDLGGLVDVSATAGRR